MCSVVPTCLVWKKEFYELVLFPHAFISGYFNSSHMASYMAPDVDE